MQQLLLALLLAMPLAAQQTWVVDYVSGPDVDFPDFPQAVQTAAPGDTIFVARRDGPLGYTAAPINKPLSVVGFQRAAQVPSGTFNTAQLDGLLTISGIPAGEQVVISGIHIWPQMPQVAQGGIEVLDCEGQILLEDCYVSNAVPYAASDYRLRVTNCADVVFRGCDLRTDGVGCEVNNSAVLLQTTSVLADSWTPPAVFPPAMTLTDSTATLVASWVWSGPHSPFTGNIPGVILYDSTLRVGPDSLVQGSLNAIGTSSWWAYRAPIPDSSVVEKDARGTLSSGQNLSPPPTPAPIDAMYHGSITANYAFWMTVYGPVDGFALLVLGEYGPPVPTPFGDLRLQGPIDLLEVVPLSSNGGYFDWTLFMPSGVPSGVALAFQSLTVSPTGELGLTEPTPFAIAWELQLPPP